MRRLAVYGTLRQGSYNYDRWMHGAEKLATEVISGFKMFSIGDAYPGITKGDSEVIFEIYELDDDVASNIERMERGAGYEVDEVDTSRGRAEVFYMPKERVSDRYKTIESGDWLAYERQLHGKGEYAWA